MRRTTAGAAATLVAVGALTGCSAEPATATQNNPARADVAAQAAAGPAATDGITVVGSGSATAEPDVLHVDVGVEVEADQVTDAFTRASEAADRLVAALQELGIAEEDIRTQDITVRQQRPEPVPPEPGAEPAEVDGYVVRNMLQVSVDDVDRAGEVLAAVVDAGGDAARVEGLSFALEDDAAVREQAREAAVEQARAQAEQYAGLVGRELGPVVSITEVGGATPAVGEAAMLDAAAPPVQPGLTTVSVQVQMSWELG